MCRHHQYESNNDVEKVCKCREIEGNQDYYDHSCWHRDRKGCSKRGNEYGCRCGRKKNRRKYECICREID